MPAGLVFVPHISWLTCRPGQRPPGISSYRPSTLQSEPSCLLHMVTLSLFLSAFAPQHSFIFSDGEGHRKAIPLSLDVCFRCPFRDIWTTPCWRMCVHISSTRRKTKKRTFFAMYSGPVKNVMYFDAACLHLKHNWGRFQVISCLMQHCSSSGEAASCLNG